MSRTQAPGGTTLRRVASIAAPWRGTLALAAGLVLAGAALQVVPPLLIRDIVDEHLTPGRADGLLALAALYLGATLAIEATSGLATYLAAVAAQGALHGLRVRLLGHLQELPIAYYDRTPLGDVVSRCTADVETLDTVFSSGAVKVVADLARLVTVSLAMVALSLPLAALAMLVVPPLAIVTRLLQVRIRAAERDNRRAVGLLNTHLQETLGGVEVIRAFGREAQFVTRFRQALGQALAAFNRATIYAALYPPTTAILAALATALLLWSGAVGMFAAWDISPGTLTAFVLLFDRFFKPITALGDEWQAVQTALSGAERIFQVLALPPDLHRPPPRDGADLDGHEAKPARPSSTRRAGAAIELRRVTFGYLEGRPVLRDISLSVRPGEHVALVGRTGAGKSSILHLLGGLYAPWGGDVRIAGRDPRDIAPEERRRIVGFVPQVVQLFGGTVLDNLTLYDPTLGHRASERAATIAGADAFIRALPNGYDTPLSGGGRGAGVQLSAGQRQLLALARALVGDPAVVLLDEATAAIDGVSDAAVRSALRASTADRSRAVLTIAHRLATAREADCVIVVEAGRVIEAGTPAELERRGGLFAALAELEAAGWDWREAPGAVPAPSTH